MRTAPPVVFTAGEYAWGENPNGTNLVPVVIYFDAFMRVLAFFRRKKARDKEKIILDNRKKSGIYRWLNKVNGKAYVGSSVNLSRRLNFYYNFSYINPKVKKGNSLIYSAILKHGYSNFQFEILEYCNAEEVINREQYYIDLLHPQYNLNPKAGSRLGSKHSEEVKLKMSNQRKGRKFTELHKKSLSKANAGKNNPNFGKILPMPNRPRPSKKTKNLISLARLGKSFLSEEMKDKMSRYSGKSVKVIDLENNKTSTYSSLKKAAIYMGITQPNLSIR